LSSFFPLSRTPGVETDIWKPVAQQVGVLVVVET